MSKMIPYPESYFSKFVPVRDEFLVALEREAEQEGIPSVGPVVGELLYILSRATGARTILELGTANGYSTIYLARACQSAKGRVITVDWDQDMAIRAKTTAFMGFRSNPVPHFETGCVLSQFNNSAVPFMCRETRPGHQPGLPKSFGNGFTH